MIHPTSLVSPKAKLGSNVRIGPFCIIHDDVELGDDCEIGAYCELGVASGLADGSPLRIGAGALIRSHSVFYVGSSFGEKLVTGHRVTVREGTRAGRNLQIGTLSDIQGHCQIGDYVRTHSNVHIGQHSKIGNFVWIYPYVVLTNDPHPPSNVCKGCMVEDYAIIATMAVLLPGVTVAKHALVAAHALVNKDVPAHTVVGGNPAKPLCDTSKIRLQDGSNEAAYPWPRHFHRGYPADIVSQWQAEFATTSQDAQS